MKLKGEEREINVRERVIYVLAQKRVLQHVYWMGETDYTGEHKCVGM